MNSSKSGYSIIGANFLSLLLIINLSILLFASNATTQEHLVSLSPEKGADSVRTKSLVKVAFDREIIASSVKSHTIELKPINPEGEKVSAKIIIDEKSTLVLTPNGLLQEGEYKVKINPIRLQADKDDYQLSSFLEKLLYWLCSLFYDDISECPLYQKFCNIPSLIKTELIEYTFSVVDKPEILSIKLNITSLELNEGETVQLSAVASYDDNSTKDITQEAVWNITDPSVASADTNATLNALQEGSAQITASLENITSQTLSLSVKKVINGHVLPPEPDETLNNSTLLGIDSNNNGVRDDVERYVIIRFSKEDFPKTRTALALQYARAKQKIIETPTRESAKYYHDAVDCQRYWFDKKQEVEYQQVSELLETDRRAAFEIDVKLAKWRLKYKISLDEGMHNIIFNTRERTKQDFAFNGAMSGGFYPGRSQTLENCQVNIDLFGE